MAVYIIVQLQIHDRAEYEKFAAGFLDVFARYKGELLVVSEAPLVVEGEWPYTRTVVMRFPSADEVRRWYESPEYQAIAQHRLRAAKTNAVIVEELRRPRPRRPHALSTRDARPAGGVCRSGHPPPRR